MLTDEQKKDIAEYRLPFGQEVKTSREFVLERKLGIAMNSLIRLSHMDDYQKEENPDVTAEELAHATSVISKQAIKEIEGMK